MLRQIILDVFFTNCLAINKIKHVVKSTLAAETLSLEDAAERCFCWQKLLMKYCIIK